ncbi:hypothetical protein ABT008_28600 [Micromonospora sp. NPDC002389]|uniref:hypothetical protein n=1 Tax=Micromonospora sp. NPDC002389 TaxID=3154272 RepID=UPI003316C787
MFISRFISVDPVMDRADPQKMHGYAYGNNSPATYTDPTGLYFEEGGGQNRRGFVTKTASGKSTIRVSGNSKKKNETVKDLPKRTPNPAPGRSPFAVAPSPRKGGEEKVSLTKAVFQFAFESMARMHTEDIGRATRWLVTRTGGRCEYVYDMWACEQGRLPLGSASGGTMYVTTFVWRNSPQNMNDKLAAHEKHHRDEQWGRYGLLFPALYFRAEAIDVWIGGDGCNRFEKAAEVASGGGGSYTC